jgi:hypothetical protein
MGDSDWSSVDCINYEDGLELSANHGGMHQMLVDGAHVSNLFLGIQM